MISIVVISKDETALEYTLAGLEVETKHRQDVEIVVVDASTGKLDHLRSDSVTWIDFPPLPNVHVTIPHQRNLGVMKARGDIIVFTDAGCEPQPGWLDALVGPILEGHEQVVAGLAVSRNGASIYREEHAAVNNGYLEECPTINLAFTREVFDQVDGFDERFDYGSDVDFSWRLRDAGVHIRRNADAIVAHDWGTRTRQAKRSYVYGQARARLYKKHPKRWQSLLRNDPIAVVYPIFILGLPITLRYKSYPLLLAVPLAKNQQHRPIATVADHLLYGAGVLREIVRI